MKKTLVALAVLAASGASFAQVALTGEIAFGYQSQSIDGVKDSGFGTDTAAFRMTATEDLGGGLKATAYMSASTLSRDNGLVGEDMGMVLAGGFGKVLLGTIEIGSGIRGLAQAGAPVNNMEGEVLGAAVNQDILKYTAPAMGGLTLSGSLTEGTGITNGQEAGESRAITVGGDYAAGALAAKLDMSSWSESANDNRYRVAASYDFGAAKIGAGYDETKAKTGATTKQTMFGISAPIGSALTVGAAFTRNDLSTAAKVREGTTFGLSYSLSKRTSWNMNFTSWDQTAASTEKSTKTWMALDHTF
jgi:predicted porin